MERLSDRWMYYCGLLADKASVEDLKHIQNLIDLEEQGLLIRLPCKVGDRIYQIEDDGYIYEFRADSIDVRKENGEYIFCIDSMDYREKDFGEIVFLTKEEAEQALERRKNGRFD